MAKADSDQEQTVEEILASIRQAISADETRRTVQPAAPLRAEAGRPSASEAAPAPPAEAPSAAAPADPVPAASPADRSQMHDVIELAIEQALDGVGEGDAPATAPGRPPPRMTPPPPRPLMRTESLTRPRVVEPRPTRELPRPAAQAVQRPGLLSPRANAAVATSFEELTRTLETQTGRGLDQAVEEMLRPMLRAWLDDNLPSLVERLVREEIERVSRGRR